MGAVRVPPLREIPATQFQGDGKDHKSIWRLGAGQVSQRREMFVEMRGADTLPVKAGPDLCSWLLANSLRPPRAI